MNIEKWEQTRVKGKLHFIWVKGFFGWGIMTAVLWSIIMHFAQPHEPIWFRPIIALVIFPIGGLFWGNWVWSSSERKYNSIEK